MPRAPRQRRRRRGVRLPSARRRRRSPRQLAAPAGRAWERFTPDGPLALLPLAQDYALVLTVPPEKAWQLVQLDEAAFLAALQTFR
jgi:2-polyprenyl-6-methoxyphenol hydroxylase-like FAD-dependent oxidoreductase